MYDLSKRIKQQRMLASLTLRALAAASGVSESHLGRIERGERFPSGRVLQKIARPLGFKEDGLFALAGFLSSAPPSSADEESAHIVSRLDPYVAEVLAKEPFEIQRSVIGILGIIKSLGKSLKEQH